MNDTKKISLPLHEYEELLATIQEKDEFIHKYINSGHIKVEVVQPFRLFNDYSHHSIWSHTIYTPTEELIIALDRKERGITEEELHEVQDDIFVAACNDIYLYKEGLEKLAEKSQIHIQDNEEAVRKVLLRSNNLLGMGFFARLWFLLTTQVTGE